MRKHFVDNGKIQRFNKEQWNNMVSENIKKVFDMRSNIACSVHKWEMLRHSHCEKSNRVDLKVSYEVILSYWFRDSVFQNSICSIELVYFRNRKLFSYSQFITKCLTNSTVTSYTSMIAMNCYDSSKKPNRYKLLFAQKKSLKLYIILHQRSQRWNKASFGCIANRRNSNWKKISLNFMIL